MTALEPNLDHINRHLEFIMDRAIVLEGEDGPVQLAITTGKFNGKELINRTTKRTAVDLNGSADAVASAIAKGVTAGLDLYVNPIQKPSMAERPAKGKGSRGSEVDVAGWVAVVLEFDVKEGQAGSEQEILNKLTQLPPELAPTMVIGSGSGGAHGWWFLEEPVTDLTEFRNLASRLHTTLCRLSGWKLDAVTDGARMMRLAGTFNNKYGDPRPVLILKDDGPDHSASELLDACDKPTTTKPADRKQLSHAEAVKFGKQLLGTWEPRNDTLLPSYHEAWIAADSEYPKIFARNLPRINEKSTKGDGPNEYDLSLADLCRLAGLTPVQAAEHCVAIRKANSEGIKTGNLQYWYGTIGKAYHEWTPAETEDNPKPPKARRKTDRVVAFEVFNENFSLVENRCVTYAIDNEQPSRAMELGSADLVGNLLGKIYSETGRVITTDVAKTGTTVAVAVQGEDIESRPVFLRVGHFEDNIVVDLGQKNDLSATVTPSGVSVGPSPVLFRRTGKTLPLPTPVMVDNPASVLAEWWSLVNVSPTSRPLVLGWMVGSYFSHPRSILTLIAPQGVVKSGTAAQIIRVTDPVTSPMEGLPRDTDRLMIRADTSHIIGFDNVSSIKVWQSDDLCRLVSGTGGQTKKENYEDKTPFTIEVPPRAIIITSTDAGLLRGDLADRMLQIELHRVDYLEQNEIDRRFDELLPRLHGAILTVLSHILRVRPTVKPKRLPRMADFGKTLAALAEVDPAITGIPAGTDILGSFFEISKKQQADTLDGPGRVILHFAEENSTLNEGQGWIGTSRELLEELVALPGWEKPGYTWPDSAPRLAACFNRIGPALEAHGVTWRFHRKTREGTLNLLAFKEVDHE